MDTFSLAHGVLDATARTECADLRVDLLQAAVRYAKLRAEWSIAAIPDRAQMDAERTRAHNVLIDEFNILSRAMARSGEDNSWRQLLGTDRRIMGDVACHMHCILALSAA